MALLDRATRRHLLALLDQLPILDSAGGRALLLADLPLGLISGVARSDVKAVDLANLVGACAAWAAADASLPHPVQTLVENALDLAAGTSVAAPLAALLAALPQEEAIGSLFLSPNARPRPWHNLPQPDYIQFVGREAELAQLHQLLLPYPRSRHFLVTLDGIGGVGKSTLALACATHYRDHYGELPPAERFDALVWVTAKTNFLTAHGIQPRPATFSNLNDLYQTLAAVLEVPAILRASLDARRDLVLRLLAAQRVLLVLDNLETVQDEALLAFLRDLPDPTKAVVTTRHRMDVAYPIRLRGMETAAAQALIAQESAARGLTITPTLADALDQRTRGVPLALVWSLGLLSLGASAEGVLARLDSGQSDIARFCFVESVAAIAATPAYSLLLALSLFEGSVNRGMLGAVAGLADDPFSQDEGLALLVQLSLVNQAEDRFSLLPLTQVFARDTLAQQPVLAEALRTRWIAVLTHLAQRYEGPEWRWHDLPLLQREGRHLVTLAAWAQQVGRLDVFLTALPALFHYYNHTGQWGEYLQVGQAALDAAQLLQQPERLWYAQNTLSWLLSQQGQHTQALKLVRSALREARAQQAIAWQCDLLQTEAQVSRRAGEFGPAHDSCAEALRLIVRLPSGDQTYVRANIEYELGKLARDEGQWTAAQALFSGVSAVFGPDATQDVFNPERAWGLLGNLGYVEHQLGNLDAAADLYEQALDFFRESGAVGYMTTTLVRFAALQMARGNTAVARAYAQEAADWSARLGLVLEAGQAAAILAE